MVEVTLVGTQGVRPGHKRSNDPVLQNGSKNGIIFWNYDFFFKKKLEEAKKVFSVKTIAIIAGLCFLGTAKLDQLGIQAIQGVIFILVAENTFFPMYSTVALIPQEFPLFIREYRAGMYSVITYYVSKIFSLVSIFEKFIKLLCTILT